MSIRAILPAAIAALLVLLFGLLYGLGYSDQYMALLTEWGVHPFRFPFVDTHAVLSAIECHRRGIDVYVENPCDVLGRIHVYSPIWLLAAVLPINTAWTPFVGFGSVALFLLSLTLLPAGRGWWQTCVIILGTISSTTAFAIERANIDIIIFVLAVLVARLVQQSRSLRLLGYSLALFAGMLKFYPITLLILAVRERLTVFVAIGVFSTGMVVGAIALYAHDLARVLSSTPTFPYFNYLSFGARDLPYGFAQIYRWPDYVAPGLLIALTIGMAAYAAVLSRRGDLHARIEALSEPESAFLMVGCVLLLGCFFTAQNLLYRGIFLLFVLPGLTALIRTPGKQRNGPLVAGCALVLLLMWSEMIRRMIDPALRLFDLQTWYVAAMTGRVWVIRQLMWWAVATMLSTLLIASLLRSQVTRDLAARFSPRRRR